MNPLELRAHRLALGLNQATLAKMIGVKQNTVSRWEKGTAPIPPGVGDDVIALADRLADLTDSCTTQGRETGTITVVDDPTQPIAAVLLVAAARAQAALRTQGVSTIIVEENPTH
ncbi:MAG: helix-turn-helix transcriptional regulator [Propionibacteriaceae bacterium]|nr:helix-turn-helix transcriptional regulator [Propionibacteriaceae bacterium]